MLSDADLVRTSRGLSGGQDVHINPGHMEGLRRVEAAVRADLLNRARLEETLREAIPHSETSYTGVFIGWAAEALARDADVR